MRERVVEFLAGLNMAHASWAVSVFLAVASGAVLLTAMWLEPASNGHGTHLQLGLNRCSFLSATGWPCPMCGATTTFALLAHLRVVEGFVNQPFAALLFTGTTAVFAVAVAEVVLPRERWSRLLDWFEPVEGYLAGGFLILMALGWIYKAWLMGML
jgi:hypothetical protein